MLEDVWSDWNFVIIETEAASWIGFEIIEAEAAWNISDSELFILDSELFISDSELFISDSELFILFILDC